VKWSKACRRAQAIGAGIFGAEVKCKDLKLAFVVCFDHVSHQQADSMVEQVT
jgi:hypothetical protein